MWYQFREIHGKFEVFRGCYEKLIKFEKTIFDIIMQ